VVEVVGEPLRAGCVIGVWTETEEEVETAEGELAAKTAVAMLP
jgi:hypothetical protein